MGFIRSDYRNVPRLFGSDSQNVDPVPSPRASRQAAGGMKKMKGGQTQDGRIAKANIKASKKIEKKSRKRG